MEVLMKDLAHMKDEDLIDELGNRACLNDESAVLPIIKQIIERVRSNSAWTNSDAKIAAGLIRLARIMNHSDLDMAHQSDHMLDAGAEYATRKRYLLARMDARQKSPFARV